METSMKRNVFYVESWWMRDFRPIDRTPMTRLGIPCSATILPWPGPRKKVAQPRPAIRGKRKPAA